MKIIAGLLAAILIAGGIFLALRTQQQPTATEEVPASSTNPDQQKDAANKAPVINEEGTTFEGSGKKIIGSYYEYSDADYQKALEEKRPIFLFFYANWCPTCAKQDPLIQEMMATLKGEQKKIVAFRVNYNDNQTSKEEEDLAKEFGVRYQHTMFALGGDGQELKKFLGDTDPSAILDAFKTEL